MPLVGAVLPQPIAVYWWRRQVGAWAEIARYPGVQYAGPGRSWYAVTFGPMARQFDTWFAWRNPEPETRLALDEWGRVVVEIDDRERWAIADPAGQVSYRR